MSLSVLTNNHTNCSEICVSGSGFSEPDFETLMDEVDALIENGCVNIIINLKEVAVLNSLGLNSLIRCFTKCRNNSGELIIVNISEKINHVLLLTKLNSVLNIAPSVEEAVVKFNS